MTIEERKNVILAKIEDIKGGSSAEVEDMRAALGLLGVTNEEETA